VIAHVAAWVPFVAGPLRLVQDGWRPVGDEAAIALRSWDSLTAHGPLVGQATRLGHGVFDPGPLQYWLLAVPAHIDPVHGSLWGAALCCMAAASLAIEAAWSVLGAAGGLCASGLILGLTLWQPSVALPPSWNPWFGMMFFLAALSAGWAVISGHRRWWPALVITASIAAQAHLMFALGSAALVLLALVAGLVDTVRARSGYWWAVIGLLAGAACWSAPAIQQFTSPDGNLAALIRSSSGSGRRTGTAFGLKALTAAVQPVPFWWRTRVPSSAIAGMISHRSAGFAVAVLLLLAVVGVVAVRPLRCRPLAALATVSLVLSLAALPTYSSIPVRNTSLRTLGYLTTLLLPIGLLCWLVVGSGAVLAGWRAAAHVRALAGARGSSSDTAAAGPQEARAGGSEPAAAGAAPARWGVRGVAAAAALLIAAGSALAVWRQSPTIRAVTADTAMQASLVASRQIERELRGQPIALSVHDADAAALGRLTLALTWVLTPVGYGPEVVRARLARELGDRYVFHGQPIPQVAVRVRHDGISVRVTMPPAGLARAAPGR